MPTDAEMLARLERMIARSHPSEWTRAAFPGDVAAILQALRTLKRYKRALENYGSHRRSCPAMRSVHGSKGQCDCGLDAALAPDPPAPTETEVQS